LNNAIKNKSKKSKNKTRELSGMISGKLNKGLVESIMAQLTGKSSFGADATPAVGMLKGAALWGTVAAVAVVLMLLGFFMMRRMRKANPTVAKTVFGAVGDTANFGLSAFGLRI
jgi:hypothetical protein